MLTKFLGFPHGFELSKGGIHEQDEPPSSGLVMLW